MSASAQAYIRALEASRRAEDRLHAAAPDLLAACEAAEDALGCNLQWITDNTKATLNADNADTLARYATLNETWRGLVIAKARGADHA